MEKEKGIMTKRISINICQTSGLETSKSSSVDTMKRLA
jgi:hypothetical protein